MNQQELLQKALETADLIAGGGDLKPEQSDKFITYLQDLSVMAKDARFIPMMARKRDINKIGIGQRVSVPAAEGADPGVRKKPTFSKTVLDTVEIMTPFEITYDVFEDNIEGDNLEDSIIKLFATQIAMDHEELYIMGDTASTDPYLALTDGWRKLANTGGHVYDHQRNGVVVDILGALLDRMPEKYLRDYADLRYYVSPNLRLLDQPTAALDLVRTENQGRLMFTLDSVKKSGGAEIAILKFVERDTPRVLQSPDDVPATGRIWIDATTGTIRQTDLTFTGKSAILHVMVTYAADKKLGLWLPVEMYQQVDVFAGTAGVMSGMGTGAYGRRQALEGRAYYSKFRQTMIDRSKIK